MKRFSFWSGLASMVGLLVTLTSMNASSGDSVATSGSNSPAINNPQGRISISYGTPDQEQRKDHVLRSSNGGQLVMLVEPSIAHLLDASMHVCKPFPGTSVIPLDERASEQGYQIWRKVQVEEGECRGKSGWVMTPDLAYE